jgi:hypothetical protein
MIKAFKVGETYTCRSICDYDCIFKFRVISRSNKTITIPVMGNVVVRKVKVIDGCETCSPHGRYSMSPILTANLDKIYLEVK